MRDLSELNLNEGGDPVRRKAPTEAQIEEFEAEFRVVLHHEYLAFLRQSNGGHPELDAFCPSGSKSQTLWGVSDFYYLNEDRTSFGGLWRQMKSWQQVIPENMIPIASDQGGTQILLVCNALAPAIKLCIHDEEFRIIDVAESFTAFIDMLTEEPDMI